MKIGAACLATSARPDADAMTDHRPTTDRQSLALDALALPVQLERAQPPKNQRLWCVLAMLGALVVVIESAWLSQAYWLQQGAVRNLLNPLLARSHYELLRPLVSDAWQVTDLGWRVNDIDPHRYQLDARLINRADILQPWPTLRLSLRDANGVRLTALDLLPRDYLPATPSDLPAKLPALAASDQPLRISLPIQLLARDNGTWPAYAAVELSPLP